MIVLARPLYTTTVSVHNKWIEQGEITEENVERIIKEVLGRLGNNSLIGRRYKTMIRKGNRTRSRDNKKPLEPKGSNLLMIAT